MAHMLNLPSELLTTIIILMVRSSGDIRDWGRVTSVCKGTYTAAMQPNFLKLSRCVQVGNPTADSAMAKVILLGGSQLWIKIQENDQANSSIKSAITLPLSDRRSIAKSLITGSIAGVPYILFSVEEEPRLYESYRRLHPIRLMKLLITLAGPMDLIHVYSALRSFIVFLLGYPKYIESGIHDVLDAMYWHERQMWLYENLRRLCKHNSDTMLEKFGEDFLPASAPKYRDPVILALDKLLQM